MAGFAVPQMRWMTAWATVERAMTSLPLDSHDHQDAA